MAKRSQFFSGVRIAQSFALVKVARTKASNHNWVHFFEFRPFGHVNLEDEIDLRKALDPGFRRGDKDGDAEVFVGRVPTVRREASGPRNPTSC